MKETLDDSSHASSPTRRSDADPHPDSVPRPKVDEDLVDYRRLTVSGEKDEGALLFKLPHVGRTSTDVRLSALEVGHDAPYDMESKFPKLRAAIKKKFGNFTRAWIVGFKQPLTGSLKFRQFVDTIQHWMEEDKSFHESVDYAAVFDAWDRDKNKSISLRDLDPVSALNFEAFRDFILQKFSSVMALFCALDRHRGPSGVLTEEEFTAGLSRLGFTGNTVSLFMGLDTRQRGCVSAVEFAWIEEELSRKSEALSRIVGQESDEQRIFKLKAQRNRQLKVERRLARQEFLLHCKQKMGGIMRAWRVLDRNEDMSISRKEFMQLCSSTGFTGNRRLAWTELDKDGSGATTLEEFDMKGAMMIAQFRDFILAEFTSFDDLFGPGMLEKRTSMEVFLSKIRTWGFHFRPPFDLDDERKLFQMLDTSGCGALRKEDIMFFRNWIPPPWLTCSPDYEACEKYITHLTQFYGTTLRAWKSMDGDGANRLSWQEFFRVSLHCKFPDMRCLPSIWRAMDKDLKGYISLKDLDHHGSEILESFVRWSRVNFGSVLTAFQVLDHDQNGELSYYEFRSAVRLYRYKGNIKELFTLLDVKNKRLLGAPAVSFLDHWDLDDGEVVKKETKSRPMVQREPKKVGCPKYWCTRSNKELEYVRCLSEKSMLPAIQNQSCATLAITDRPQKRKVHEPKKLVRDTLLAYGTTDRPRKAQRSSPYKQAPLIS